jgi:hypothetical protein
MWSMSKTARRLVRDISLPDMIRLPPEPRLAPISLLRKYDSAVLFAFAGQMTSTRWRLGRMSENSAFRLRRIDG